MTETKFTFVLPHPTDSDLVVFLVRNTTTERIKTGRKYGLDWYMKWDYDDRLPESRREFTERVLIKDYYDIVEMIKWKLQLGINFGGELSLYLLLKRLKEFEPSEW